MIRTTGPKTNLLFCDIYLKMSCVAGRGKMTQIFPTQIDPAGQEELQSKPELKEASL
jgi:hypothetical protein